YFISCVVLTVSPTSDIFTLSLHDALPICGAEHGRNACNGTWSHDVGRWWYLSTRQLVVFSHCRRLYLDGTLVPAVVRSDWQGTGDRKSTRLNSSHQIISYAVFCLKKKKMN